MSYQYLTCCIHSTAEAIDAMTDNAIGITYRTMFKHCPGLIDWAEQMGYARHPSQGLTLKQDWHVSYHRSSYCGRRCYYLCHSAIEYIFVEVD